MSTPTLPDFLDRLTALGYRAPSPAPLRPPCTHEDAGGVVLQIPRPAFGGVRGARTYGDVGWRRHDGCEDCTRRFAEALTQIDAALCVWVFRGEQAVGGGLGLDANAPPDAEARLPWEPSPLA